MWGLGGSRAILGFGVWFGFLEVEEDWADVAWWACEVHLNYSSLQREGTFDKMLVFLERRNSVAVAGRTGSYLVQFKDQ